MMQRNHQFHKMVALSLCLHLILVAIVALIYMLRPTVEITPLSEEAHQVDLYEPSELPEELPTIPEELQETAPEVSQNAVAAFGNISTLIPTPTPSPTLTPVPVSTPTPKPSPTLTPVPVSTPTPRPKPTPTVKPRPTPVLRPTPRLSPPFTPTPRPQTTVVAFDVPRRQAILEYTPAPGRQTPVVQPQSTPIPSGARQSGTGQGLGTGDSILGEGSSLTLDQEEAFPFPEYLHHLQEKIAGLWFPEGSGMVSVYLIIGRNGKILKSGVDKGEGLGVEKLRDSVIRTLVLIKGFEPLPQDYNGMVLRVRITVRR